MDKKQEIERMKEHARKVYVKNALKSLQETIDLMNAIEDNKYVKDLTQIYNEIENKYIK